MGAIESAFVADQQGQALAIIGEPLAMGVFAILAHTPVSRMGINRHFHFATPSVDVWHAIGDGLAPKEPWHEIMKLPGLRSMLMEGRREETSQGLLHIKVEPSVKVTHGIYVEVNEEENARNSVES